jgi:hypothetical protein
MARRLSEERLDRAEHGWGADVGGGGAVAPSGTGVPSGTVAPGGGEVRQGDTLYPISESLR